MDINDSGKNEILDKIMEQICKAQIEYTNCLGNQERMAQLKETLAKHTLNYNTLIAKRANRIDEHRINSYCIPGPQSPEELKALYKLIDSV